MVEPEEEHFPEGPEALASQVFQVCDGVLSVKYH
jgi:hypothetical protein